MIETTVKIGERCLQERIVQAVSSNKDQVAKKLLELYEEEYPESKERHRLFGRGVDLQGLKNNNVTLHV